MIFDICTSKSGRPYNIIKLPVKCIIVCITFVLRDDGTCGLAICDTSFGHIGHNYSVLSRVHIIRVYYIMNSWCRILHL